MNSTLATEPAAVTAGEKPSERSALPPLERWSGNERMRHVPSAEWMARKLETDIRKRTEKLVGVYTSLASTDPRYDVVDKEVRALCRSLERLIDAVKPSSRHNGQNSDVAVRVDALILQAASTVRTLEPTAFGRRHPYHLFDRSKAEPVYAALLAVLWHVEQVLTIARTIDSEVDERLLANPPLPVC